MDRHRLSQRLSQGRKDLVDRGRFGAEDTQDSVVNGGEDERETRRYFLFESIDVPLSNPGLLLA